jgi:hypothetical protein
LGVHLTGGRIDVDEHGDPIIGDHILALYNADHAVKIPFTLPRVETGQFWQLQFDTSREGAPGEPEEITASKYELQPCSMAVYTSPVPEEEPATFFKVGETTAKTPEDGEELGKGKQQQKKKVN